MSLQRIHKGELERPVAPAPALRRTGPRGLAGLVLQLQRTAGNAAVTSSLSGGGTLIPSDPAVEAAGETARGRRRRPQTETAGQVAQDRRRSPQEKFTGAVGAQDWAEVAQLLSDIAPVEGDASSWLLGHPWMFDALDALTADQLRYVDDATRRLDLDVSLPREAITVVLMGKGVFDEQAEPGRGYGEVTVQREGLVQDGRRARDGRYRYGFQVAFQPSDAVDAEEIAFIQTVQVIDSDTKANLSPNSETRMIRDRTKIDRLNGKEQGWYGMKDDGSGQANFTPWVRGGTTPASMYDYPSWTQPSCEWSFETSVVCRKGADAGKVYAVIHWGFTVAADLKIAPKPHQIFNKPSRTFGSAINAWNSQTKLSAGSRNAPGQKPLPELR
ncbi:hypothetical protein [Pseudonocardia alaniniphila]|uniref:hypothetical protein n=1 Tax=Pseudonocardia alaniniphila TaxID=75291 RepID=UPI0031D02B4F